MARRRSRATLAAGRGARDGNPKTTGGRVLFDEQGIEVLSVAECRQLLEQGSVGRVAITVGAVPAVLPVNYRVLDGDVVFRTAQGTKLDAAVRNAVVAFEVDQVDPLYHEGWSVLVVGVAREIPPGPERDRALALPLEPWAPGERTHVVRIATELISGRRISHHLGPPHGDGTGG